MAEIKFCGLTRPEDAAEASRLGARYAGVVFAPSPRMVDAVAARRVLAGAGSWVRRVGVFDARPAADIARVARDASLHVVQLHGDANHESVADVRAVFDGTIWAVLRVAGSTLPDGAERLFATADAVVLDARVDGDLGGTGRALEWDALAAQVQRLRGDTPLVLAGGLRAENVIAAVRALAPDVVDVSSGVEVSAGIKDHARMRAFADAVALVRAA